MRKLGSALAVAAGLTLLAGPAHAQDTHYPPDSDGLTVSVSTVAPGERFTVSGAGAQPGATITFTLRRSPSALGAGRIVAAGPSLIRLGATNRSPAPISLGTTTDANGEFSATLTVPEAAEPGVYSLTASSGDGILAVMTLRVVTLSGIGGLPFTGANVLPGLAIGAGFVVAGGLLLLSLKRRRPAA
jgi:hypothetical protein